MNKKKTIVQFISTGGFYGAERVVLELSAFLNDRGFLSKIAVVQSPGAQILIEKAEKQNLEISVLRGEGLGSLGLLWKIKNYVQKNDVDIIHSHSYKTDILIRLAGLCSKLKIIATCHTWYSYSAKMKLYESLDKWSLKSFNHVVLVSPQLVEDVRNFGLPIKKTSLINNGVYLPPCAKKDSRQKVRAEFGIKNNETLILRVGRLVHSKGNTILLDAFARVVKNHRTHILFVGEGEEQDLLLKRSEILGIKNHVTFAGFRNDIPELLQASDLFVISSYKEGLPMVLLEAMAAGKAIVATDVGAISSVIIDGRNGWVVPPGQPESLSNALTEAILHPNIAKQFAKSAYEHYLDGYSREAMGSQYLKLYESL